MRQLVRDDGKSEVLEPRVMQVLIALARAEGNIVSRDDLTRSCWEDRIVGEDAINRVISRLRRVAGGIGAGSFRIETVTKVGYRLAAERAGSDAHPTAGLRTPRTRRALIVGGATVALSAAAGGAWYWPRHTARHAADPQLVALLEQALGALRQDTHEGQTQAIGLLRRLVAEQPDYADGWGALAMTYAFIAHYRASTESAVIRARANAAADRAEALEPGNAYALVARGNVLPRRRNWRISELALRRGLKQHPGNAELLFTLALTLGSVGRDGEAAPLLDRARRQGPPNPALYFREIVSLWTANRLEEADQLMDDASELYPSHFAIWFARVYIMMYSGRAAAALAMIENVDGRPTGIPSDEFENVGLVVRAIASRNVDDIDRAMPVWRARAHTGAGLAENAIQFASFLGRLDDAFTIAGSYYFNRPFAVPEIRFNREQATYTPPAERLTSFLFNPATAAMRADPRFGPLVAELGLEHYWREAGVLPDYRRT
ncbi:MAG TPA: winged helix-turn-helix domain-containing protein [Sphingomonas sp.]|nr:winged helix-turn-helix domain-containing protein [Sphingomonas sp.]